MRDVNAEAIVLLLLRAVDFVCKIGARAVLLWCLEKLVVMRAAKERLWSVRSKVKLVSSAVILV